MTALFKAPAITRYSSHAHNHTPCCSLEKTRFAISLIAAHIFLIFVCRQNCVSSFESVCIYAWATILPSFAEKENAARMCVLISQKYYAHFMCFVLGAFFAADVLLWAHFLHQVAFFFSFTPLLPMMISYVCVVSLFFFVHNFLGPHILATFLRYARKVLAQLVFVAV